MTCSSGVCSQKVRRTRCVYIDRRRDARRSGEEEEEEEELCLRLETRGARRSRTRLRRTGFYPRRKGVKRKKSGHIPPRREPLRVCHAFRAAHYSRRPVRTWARRHLHRLGLLVVHHSTRPFVVVTLRLLDNSNAQRTRSYSWRAPLLPWRQRKHGSFRARGGPHCDDALPHITSLHFCKESFDLEVLLNGKRGHASIQPTSLHCSTLFFLTPVDTSFSTTSGRRGPQDAIVRQRRRRL